MNARKSITPENAYLRLATLCAQSEQAEGDLRKKLHDWGIGGNDINAIIARLKQEKYLDNDRFYEKLRHTFAHELRHHLEMLSGIRSLNKYDDQKLEMYERGMDIAEFHEPPIE